MYVAFYLEKLPEFSQVILQHDVLEHKLTNKSYGANTRKHLLQNSSLLKHLEQAGLVQDDTCFIEFGAGKGMLNINSAFYLQSLGVLLCV